MEQSRWKSWAMWTGIAGALWLVASAFNLPQKLGITEATYLQVINGVCTILALLGIINNPENKSKL